MAACAGGGGICASSHSPTMGLIESDWDERRCLACAKLGEVGGKERGKRYGWQGRRATQGWRVAGLEGRRVRRVKLEARSGVRVARLNWEGLSHVRGRAN